MFGGLKQDLKDAGIRWVAGGIFREIAEGKRGPTLQRWLLVSRGYKTVTGSLLAILLAGVLQFAPQLAPDLTPYVAPVSLILIVGGLIDKAWRATPPPVWFMDGLHKVMSWGPAASALVAAATQVLELIPATKCQGCAAAIPYIDAGAAGVASVTGWLAAYCAKPVSISLPPGGPNAPLP